MLFEYNLSTIRQFFMQDKSVYLNICVHARPWIVLSHEYSCVKVESRWLLLARAQFMYKLELSIFAKLRAIVRACNNLREEFGHDLHVV